MSEGLKVEHSESSSEEEIKNFDIEEEEDEEAIIEKRRKEREELLKVIEYSCKVTIYKLKIGFLKNLLILLKLSETWCTK